MERIIVQRRQRPYWEERGWTRTDNLWQGYFRTRFGSWKGKAKVSWSGRVELFIQSPPEALQKHRHWSCFLTRADGWYFIHTHNRIKDLSAGILEVENILVESYEKTS